MCVYVYKHTYIPLFFIHLSVDKTFKLGFPCGSAVGNQPAVQQTQVRSMGQEDPLKDSMATHSGILAWRVPWTEEPDGLHGVAWVHGVAKSRTRLSN